MGNDDTDLDVRLLLARVVGKLRWVIASVVIFTAAFAAWAFLATPYYRAATILVPAGESGVSGIGAALGQMGGLASLVGLNLSSPGTETEEALAVLKSRQFTEDFIRDKSLLPKFFPSKWNGALGVWRVDPLNLPSLAEGYRYFDRKLRSVETDKKSGLVTLQIDWRDRAEAADWANDLIKRLNEEMRLRAIKKANAAVGYLEKESNATSTVVTRDAIGRLVEAQVNRRMMANVTEEFAFRVVDRALPADKDDPVRPKKVLLIVIGALLGIAVGILVALFLSMREVEYSKA